MNEEQDAGSSKQHQPRPHGLVAVVEEPAAAADYSSDGQIEKSSVGCRLGQENAESTEQDSDHNVVRNFAGSGVKSMAHFYDRTQEHGRNNDHQSGKDQDYLAFKVVKIERGGSVAEQVQQRVGNHQAGSTKNS